jgi:VIT1/CCC1 family predicted Fe2+/Mn2+ transporter
MNNPQNKNLTWAQEDGYGYNAESEGVTFEGARSLDIFRKAESFRDHVRGIYRNRPFEILDVHVEVSRSEEWRHVWKTIVLIPTDGLDLPNFDLLPRGETGGMSFLGIKGLDLKLAPTAPQDERQLVDAFNKNYSLFGGGAFEAMEASIKSADELVPSLASMASICKPRVLRFLANASTGVIEVQNGYVAIRAPEPRIIAGAFSDIILQGRERESLLAVANDLLDVLGNAASESPLRTLTLENTFNPYQLLGNIIGGVIGFCLGGFIAIVLLFLRQENYSFLTSALALALIPALALGGAVLGRFIGNTLMRFKGSDNAKASSG